ncbi:TPA: hypothetical protein N0F65_002864 [Lagenidium giganteum]|uniref:Phytanoyl-CoA dioxygenase n=1 Tax=Lagenidium giganteum TaxID=4803 RepID=A0AAV2ZAX5_9STRA|nr:TPA: hypothetical protein N0F65_002864 [Lagenidium giganteum]
MNGLSWLSELDTGAVVELSLVHAPAIKIRALVEKKSEGGAAAVLSFGSLERPYEKLRVNQNGHVDWAIAAAKFASFLVEELAADDAIVASLEVNGSPMAASDCHVVFLKSLVHQKKVNCDGELGWYLGTDLAGESGADAAAPLIGNAARGSGSLFSLRVVSARAAFAIDPARTRFEGAFAQQLSILSPSQRQSFIQNGYLVIHSAVPMHLVNAALRRINHDLGVPGRMIDGGVEGAAKLSGNVSNSDEILNLFHLSSASAYAEALVGIGKVAPPQGAQIALRFPELGEPREPLGTEWHTDGMRQGKLHPFTLLLGVALSEVREPLSGNFTVFPGSHQSLAKMLRPDGKLAGCDDECYRADSVWGDGTLPDLGIPVQLLASRGDIVLAHPNLAHRGGLNFSPDIRYQVYFRLKHVAHAELQQQSHSDIYIDLEGLANQEPSQ